MGAVSTLAALSLQIKGAIRTALNNLATAIDANTTNITANATNITNYAVKSVVETVTDNKILTAADSGKVFLIGTDEKTFTLPSTAAGLRYVFVNSGADGNNIITISPAALDAIHGTITLADSVVELGGVDNKDLINTKATAKTGNMVELVGDGVVGWYVVRSTGIWASE